MNPKEIVLLNGIFSTGEATHLLYSFLDFKIRYHQMEIFSAQEASSTADVSHNQRRLRELVEAKNSLKAILHEAEKKDCRLVLKSVVQIEEEYA